MKLQNLKLVYSDVAVCGASSVELVIMLFDMLVSDLHNAVEAIQGADIERRTNELQHALRVLEQLQGTLREKSGDPSTQQLDRFYDCIRGGILQAQLRSSTAELEKLIAAVVTVRSAWEELRDKSMNTPSLQVTSPQAEATHPQWSA